MWAIDGDGTYQVSMTYQVPRLATAVPQPCAGSSDPATVKFTVAGSDDGSPAGGGSRQWAVVAAVVVGLAGLGLGLVLLRHRYRHRHRGGAAGVLLVVAASVSFVVPNRPAAASVGSSDASLDHSVQTCLGKISAVGGPSAEIVKYYESNGTRIRVFETRTPREGSSTQQNRQNIFDVRNMSVEHGGYVIGEIYWSPVSADWLKFADNVGYDPCASLLHELTHIYSRSTGQLDPRYCTGSALTIEEVRTVQAENTYREAVGLPPRTTHNDDAVPALSSCDQSSPLQRLFDPEGTRPFACFGVSATKCGRSRGEPHLTTFDNLGYDFQAAGEFVAVRSDDGTLEVQTRQTPAFGAEVVTLNSAVAAKVGPDRVSFQLRDGQVEVRVDGGLTNEPGTLPGGGTLKRRPAWSPFGESSWSLAWPDGSKLDVDLFGDSWLDVSIELAPALAGKVSGLLGDFDGDAGNDITPHGGEPLGRTPDFDALYRTFGESWRVDQQTALFDYLNGKSTATFTDRSVPQHPATADALDPDVRERARQVCTDAGISEPAILNACMVDVAHTGQVGFVVSAQVSEQVAPPSSAAGSVSDGDTVTGQIDVAGTAVRYGLDLAGATDFFVADWRGPGGGCDQAFSVNLVGISTNNLPCADGAVNFHVPDRAARYQLEIAALPGRSGGYSFSLVTVKIRHSTIPFGSTSTGTITARGEQHRLEFDPAGAQAIRLTRMPACPSGVTGDLYDITTSSTVTGRQLCGGDLTVDLPDPAHRYAIVVRSADLTTGPFAFTLSRG